MGALFSSPVELLGNLVEPEIEGVQVTFFVQERDDDGEKRHLS